MKFLEFKYHEAKSKSIHERDNDVIFFIFLKKIKSFLGKNIYRRIECFTSLKESQKVGC